jgi:hypothetical protein
MLSNFWVLILLFGQVLNILLSISVLPGVVIALRKWSSDPSDLQLDLERKSYLTDFVIQLNLFFQVLLFFVFFQLINAYLPQIISGAMCAEGVLNLNRFGYPSFYIKLLQILFIPILLIINKLDLKSPQPLFTPRKYYLFLVGLILMLVDFWFTFSFLAAIQPNIITTCCSLSFLNNQIDNHSVSISQYLVEIAQYAFMSLGFLLVIFNLRFFSQRSILLYTILAILFIISGLYSLKYFFIKFIYGLPNHYCLYDLFLAKNLYLGYGLFLAYFLFYYNLLELFLAKLSESKIQLTHSYFHQFAPYNLILTLIIWLVPLIYYFTWQGTL